MVHQSSAVPQPEGPPFKAETEGSLEDVIASLRAEATESYLAMPEVIQHPPKRGGRPLASPRRGSTWRWLLLSLLSCLATSAAAVGAFLWLVTLPPSTNCSDPAQITTDRAALSCAQIAADDGNLEAVVAGLNLVESWGPDHWLSHEIEPLVEEWSAVTVAAAEQELRNGRRDEAVALLEHIPRQSAWYGTGQKLLADWNQDWEAGSALVAKAKTAMAQQDWRTASAQVLALGELSHPHWREEQVQAISRQIQAEQQAQAQIRRAVTLASAGGTERLIAAMGLLLPLSSDLLAHETAQAYLDRWSDLLLTEGLQRWYGADLDRAVHIGQAVSRNPNRAQVAQEFLWLSRSRQLARQSLEDWRVSPTQMAALYRAMLLVNRIPNDSPYHPQAESSLATWRAHLEGMGTLQLAQLPGGIAQIDTLKLAIQQAESIAPDHPRRVQAQTLVAHWRQLLERIEDAPYLAQAHQWAKANTPDGLRQAITSASRITPNRALRQDAQGWIYVWNHRLQTLEDRPVLDRAYELAEKGQLSQAVVEASGVQPGRALYDEAQTAIGQWRRTIAAQEQARDLEGATNDSLPDPVQPVARPVIEPSALPRPAAPVSAPAPAMRPPVTAPPATTANTNPPQPEVIAPSSRPSQLPDRIETVPDSALPAPAAAPPRPLMTPTNRPAVPLAPPPVITTPPPVAEPSSGAARPSEVRTSAFAPTLPPLVAASRQKMTAPVVSRISLVPAAPSRPRLTASKSADVMYSGALYAGL